MRQIHKREEFYHNGERSRAESGWTWVCSCGDSESASTKDETLREWQRHLDWRVRRFAKEQAEPLLGLVEIECRKMMSVEQSERFIERVLTGKRTVNDPKLKEWIFNSGAE